MGPPERDAIVRPRVVDRARREGLPLLLDDAVRPRVAAGETGLVRLCGVPGSGKTTALAYLAGALGALPGLALHDEPERIDPAEARSALVVYATDEPLPGPHVAELVLVEWGMDEHVEYLLAHDPDRCRSVMERLERDPVAAELPGHPELWCAILEELAEDDSLKGVDDALRSRLGDAFADSRPAKRLRRACLATITEARRPERLWRKAERKPVAPDSLRLARRHGRPALLLAAAEVHDHLRARKSPSSLRGYLPKELIRALGAGLERDDGAFEYLEELVESPKGRIQSRASSVLNAADSEWLGRRLRAGFRSGPPNLDGASLEGAVATRVEVGGLDVSRADLTGSDWSGSRLPEMTAIGTSFRDARLRDSELEDLDASMACFAGADLSGAEGDRARFGNADLIGARLDNARFEDAHFHAANLTGASFEGANLACVDLARARVDGASFRAAWLAGATLRRLDLRPADWRGAVFESADLGRANLEGLELDRPRFAGAYLCQALLTGSSMPEASFRGAVLRGAGLAQVCWEGADLRDADLANASFHLGSTRSGILVGGYPSEGTRTGFYTDELANRGYKSPEEIRVADLRFADLRGASVEDADFYLVDLRGARYSREQGAYFRRCGAILGE